MDLIVLHRLRVVRVLRQVVDEVQQSPETALLPEIENVDPWQQIRFELVEVPDDQIPEAAPFPLLSSP